MPAHRNPSRRHSLRSHQQIFKNREKDCQHKQRDRRRQPSPRPRPHRSWPVEPVHAESGHNDLPKRSRVPHRFYPPESVVLIDVPRHTNIARDPTATPPSYAPPTRPTPKTSAPEMDTQSTAVAGSTASPSAPRNRAATPLQTVPRPTTAPCRRVRQESSGGQIVPKPEVHQSQQRGRHNQPHTVDPPQHGPQRFPINHAAGHAQHRSQP